MILHFRFEFIVTVECELVYTGVTGKCWIWNQKSADIEYTYILQQQSTEMWSPTHVQVLGNIWCPAIKIYHQLWLHCNINIIVRTCFFILHFISQSKLSLILVKRAKGLNLKGKNGERKMVGKFIPNVRVLCKSFQAPMTHLWQYHWAKKDFKPQWKRNLLILLTGVNSVNCKNIDLLLIQV